MMYDSIQVALEMLKIARSKGKKLSNLQLQKLVYIAHGYYLAWKNQPLISDPVEAWQYGPVINKIYHQFKNHKDAKIELPSSDFATALDCDEGAQSVISYVLDSYGDRDAMSLVNLTHQENTPWSEIRNRIGGNFNNHSVEIPNELIYNHFLNAMINPQSVNGL